MHKSKFTPSLSALWALLALPVAAESLEGSRWRFEDDGTLVRFEACDAALCARIVGPAQRGPQAGRREACGQRVLDGLQPGTTPGHWRGRTLDPGSGRAFDATLQAQPGPRLRLTASAMGGLVSESFMLAPAGDATAGCAEAAP